jgi:methionine-rich copper-binding protein CopC
MREASTPVRSLLRLAALTLAALALTGSPAAAHENEEEPVPVTETGVSDGSATTMPPEADRAAQLHSSWPEDGVMLWVPPKEGRLGFHEPVKASTLVLELRRSDGVALVDDEVVRLTSGEAVTEILLRLPPIRPGDHLLEWSVESAAGVPFEGTLRFGLEEPIAAVGGQNHRHGESHLYEDTPGQFALRLLFVLAVSLLFAAVRRTRSRSNAGPVEKTLVRVGAGLLLLTTLVTGVVDAAAWLDEYHDKPLSAFLAAPGLSLVLPVLLFALLVLVTGRTSDLVAWSGIGVLAAYAGLSHAIRTALGAELFVAFTVLLTALALLWAELLSGLLGMLAGRIDEVAAHRRTMFVSAGALLAASLLMLFLHAGTLDLQMAFARDLRSRLTLGVLLLGSLGVLPLLANRSRALRILLVVPVAVLMTASALLAWMPPPAAGL